MIDEAPKHANYKAFNWLVCVGLALQGTLHEQFGGSNSQGTWTIEEPYQLGSLP